MIPFASQRGEGQDLAIHLQNEHDNEYVEIAHVRGAIADDLPGAFAEWEAQAAAMTKCTNYLYSLSVNPDPAQGPISRDLYDDYIGRAERALGLDAQPRAVVFHIKEDRNGIPREHCHVVWSRIDVQEMKAIQMSFDYDKLMTVTRQFARDHDIQLAPGYYNLEDRKRQTYRQLSLYDKAQQESVGLLREERRALVTELWHGRDTPASFIKALEYHGYVLASGKRPFVLVDIYGHTNSLPKLIDDKAANTNAIRAFMGVEFSEENLPSVEKAVKATEKHRQSLKAFKQSEKRADKIDELKEHHTKRREKLEQELASFLDRQKQERIALHDRHRTERDTHRSTYLEQAREIKRARHENKPRGLAGFLSKVTGVEQIRHKVHRYQDKKQYDAFVEQRHETRGRQDEERLTHQRAQEMHALDMQRKHRALDHTEMRELQSLEQSFEKQQAIRYRNGHEHMPTLQLELSPPGRKAVPHKAKGRFTSEVGRELFPLRKVRTRNPAVRDDTVHNRFNQAAQGRLNPDGSRTGSTALPLKPQQTFKESGDPVTPEKQDPELKPSDSAKEDHINRAMREFDRKDEKLSSSQRKNQPRSQIPDREFKVDRQAEGAAPDQTQNEEPLARTFDASASGNISPDKESEGRSDHPPTQPVEPEKPERIQGPKPQNNDPDHDR